MATTNISWTNKSWNAVTGCSEISPGCKNCYAKRLAKRLNKMGQKKYRNVFQVTCHEYVLDEPLSWKKPCMIFVNSMADLFHEDVPEDFIKKVFEIMNKANWHTFQFLTKRPDRLVELSSKLRWTSNIWAGVTVENADYLSRIELLREVPARIKFVSFEPLLGSVADANLTGVDWVIVGGESGPGARPMAEEWVIEIQAMCAKASIPFFFKQWGGVRKKENGDLLRGQICQEYPKA